MVPAPRNPRDRPPPPPVVAYEDIIASCGHVEKFGLYDDRKDKFRKDRRKKAAGRPCKACRERKYQEEQEAIKVRQAQKQQRAAAATQATPPPNPQKKQAEVRPERLPDGSKFAVVYDATGMQWTGTLTIGTSVFTGSAGGLFKLLNLLDLQYRQSLPPAPA